MKSLPIYPTLPSAAVQSAAPLEQNENCNRCALHATNPKRCIPADGQPGDILIIGESPTEFERKLGRPFASAPGQMVRKLIEKYAPGRNVVYKYAVGCKVGSPTSGSENDIKAVYEQAAEAAVACRGYVNSVIQECKPKLVILMGALAGQSVLDRRYDWLDVRGGYAWLNVDGQAVPAYLMANPSVCSRNHLYAKAFEQDLERILTDAQPNRAVLSARYHVVETLADAQAALEELKQHPFVATDVETSGMMFEADFRIECLAVSGPNHVYVFPRSSIEDENIRGALLGILHGLRHTSWNGQYDLCAIQAEPLFAASRVQPLLGLDSDARLKRKLLNASAAGDLATCADLVGMGGHKDAQRGAMEAVCGELRALSVADQLTPTGRPRKAPKCLHVRVEEVPKTWLVWLRDGYAPEKFAHRFVDKEIEHRYVALDALSTWHLEDLFQLQLMEQDDLGQLRVWEEVTKPSMYAWCRARLNGFPTDKNAVEALSAWLKAEAEATLKKIHAYKPGLNPRSTKQVGEFLNSLGLKSKRKTDSGEQSWSKDVLEKMSDKHPVIALLTRYKLLTHTDTSFVGGMLNDIRTDGRVHPSYLQDGTESGRPSSQDPNFFNRLKGRDAQSRELGNMLRSCHRAPPGWKFIEADMGQIEIRLAAYRSRDAAMIEMLNSGVDFHTRSSELFAPYVGKDFATMSQEERDIFREQSKTSNFAAIYEIPSQLGFMLSKRLGIDSKAGRNLGDAMFKTYTGLRKFMDDSYSQTYITGYTRTYWKGQPGRKRPMWGMGKNPPTLKDLESTLRWDRDDHDHYDVTAARGCYNTDIQGCYPGHMKILTREGYTAIGDAPEVGTVWTGSEWKRYTKLDRGEAQLADIQLANGHLHHCDVRHKLLIAAEDGYVFRHYDQLKPGDRVCLSLAQEIDSGDADLDPYEAYWMGFCIGNGCSRQRNAMCVTFGDRKDRYTKDAKFAEFVAWAEGHGWTVGKCIKSGCITARLESKKFRQRWETDYGYPWGAKAKEKSIPSVVWRAKLAARRQFLLGLLDADGTVGSNTAPNLHMGAEQLLREVQILFRTIGIETYFQPIKSGSFRLSLNAGQAKSVLDYGRKARTLTEDNAPAFLVREFISKCPTWSAADRSGYVLHARMKSGGTTGIYTFLKMVKQSGVKLSTPIYATSTIKTIRALDKRERTYTLSVEDPGHRFDCEGVIAKNSAVDIVTSMLKPVVDWLDANTNGGQFLIQIYDSIMVMVRDEDVDKTLKFLMTLMTDNSPVEGLVPLVADAKVGQSWDTMKKVKVS